MGRDTDTEDALMSDAAEKLKVALLELPLHERLEVADFLYESAAPPSTSPAVGTPEFDALLKSRLEDLETGRDKGIPAEEVLERLRKKYQR
jgi:putative addiction module component (TIGR02574 family)